MLRPVTDTKQAGEAAGDLKEMIVAYAKQETIEPIKGLGRYVGFGVAGSIMVGIAGILGGLAILRALQAETGDTFDGQLTWAPYAITAGICLMLMAGAVWAAGRGGRD